MFHSKKIEGTTKNFRAFALLYNLSPSCPAARIKDEALASSAARLNGFTYHKDWLHNLSLLLWAGLGITTIRYNQKIKFEISNKEQYNPKFVEKILESRREAKNGMVTPIEKENLKTFLGL